MVPPGSYLVLTGEVGLAYSCSSEGGFPSKQALRVALAGVWSINGQPIQVLR